MGLVEGDTLWVREELLELIDFSILDVAGLSGCGGGVVAGYFFIDRLESFFSETLDGEEICRDAERILFPGVKALSIFLTGERESTLAASGLLLTLFITGFTPGFLVVRETLPIRFISVVFRATFETSLACI